MKRFALAVALACVLSGSALAGDVHSTGEPAPGETSGPPTPGEIPMVGDMPADLLLTILDLAF